jgi:hypothetical protein
VHQLIEVFVTRDIEQERMGTKKTRKGSFKYVAAVLGHGAL